MSLQRIFTLVALLLVVAVLIVAGSHSQKAEPAVQANPSFINHTKSLEVISAVRNGAEVYFAFRNDSDKTAMTYVVSCGNKKLVQTTITEDFAFSGLVDSGILPHTVYEGRVSICGSTEKHANNVFVIEAVVFEGGTGDGNPAVIQEVHDSRLGRRIQIERTLKLLDNYLSLPSSKISAGLGELKSQVVSKLDSPEADNLAALIDLEPSRESKMLTEHVQSGLGDGKNLVLGSLQDAEAAQNTREGLLKVKEYYERVLRRF